MADVITRFKLETTQYDSALRDASQGLAKLTEQLALAGNEFGKFSQKDVEAAKSLGQVESGATNLKDKLRDLVSAYNNVAKAYENLTNEQKQTDYGKAMASSLEQLQQRITATKNELYGMTDSTKQTGDGLGALNNIFGTSITKLAGWGAAIAGIKGALNVAKDAFFASEQNLDDWNRMVYSSQSTYEAFLTSLNTGDVSGFLNNITTIVKAANDAYDAIDRLQTTQNVQTPQVAKRQAELQRFETMLRTGRYIAPIDGRTATPGLKEGDKLTKAQKDRVANQVENIIRELAGLTKKEVDAATDAVDKLFNNQALRLGMTKQQFLAGTANIETFERNVDLGKKYQEWEINRRTAIDLAKAGHYNMMSEDQKQYINTPNPYQQYRGWNVFKDDGELYQSILTNIKNRTAKEQEYYSMLARSYRQINRVEGYKPYSDTKLTDPEKAQQKYEQAMANYSHAMEQAALEVEAGTLSGVDAKKKELQAEESLWKAIGDAREIYDTPELKAEQQKVADKVKALGGSITALVAEQKSAQEAARELASAQKKLSDAETKMAEALKANDYKAYTAAYKQYTTQQAEVQRLQPTIEPSIKMPQVDVPQVVMPSIPSMSFDVEARTESALDSLNEIEGVTFDEKTLTVTANTQEALDALNNIEGITLSPKSLTVEVPDMKEVFSYTQNNMTALIARLND